MRSKLAFAVCTGLILATAAAADTRKSVREFGAQGDGQANDTAAFQMAIDATRAGDTLYVPSGTYVIKATLKVSRAISIVGAGLGSQLFGDFEGSLIQVRHVEGGAVRDLFLGSRANTTDAGLLELVNTTGSKVTNVTMLGGVAGLLLKGSGGNLFTDIRSGTNFQGQYEKIDSVSMNQVWIHAIGSTSNTYIAPVLEGGGDGMLIEEPAGSCNGASCTSPMLGFGAVAEGVAGNGIALSQVSSGAHFVGTYLEANKGVSLLIKDASNVTFSGLLSVDGVGNEKMLITSSGAGKTSNVKIEEGFIRALKVDPGPTSIQLENIVMPDLGALQITPAVTTVNVAADGT